MMDFGKLLSAYELDTLLISSPANVRYLSGFTNPKDAQVIVSKSGATLLTDGRYTVQAGQESHLPVRIAGREERPQVYAELLQGRIGFEAMGLSYGQLETLRQQAPGEWVPTHDLIEQYRVRKSPQETGHIRAAANLADRAFEHILPFLQPGAREIDIALELEFFLRKNGSEGVAFDTAVVSGPRSAMPHGSPSERVLQAGDLVTLDFGAVVEGYCSDMTRTVGVGAVSEELKRIYAAVLEAQQQSLEAVAPGKTGQELDALARGILEGKGYGQYFSHGLGHGVGLLIHEAPSLNKISEDVLEPGMVITIEPGVYIPDLGGVRIEDLVLVTEQGYEVLSHTPKDWLEL
ncbi:MAG TPA: aminopeptidase P family protein [Meiothermus sp.]|nr:aminopeptidase P family protein [Meiothermus sp.]